MTSTRSLLVLLAILPIAALPAKESTIDPAAFERAPRTLRDEPGPAGVRTWWLPHGPEICLLPIAAGVRVETISGDADLAWLRAGSPWSLRELPFAAFRYGSRWLAVAVPWPHYAELVVEEQNRFGIRFRYPEGRHRAAPCEVVLLSAEGPWMSAVESFRAWRARADTPGGIPRPRPLGEKIDALSEAGRLPGAAHIYLWGRPLFSRHDAPRRQWPALARAIRDAPDSAFGARLREPWADEEREALEALAISEWPSDHLTTAVAGAIDTALASGSLLNLPADRPAGEVIRRNREALAAAFPGLLHSPSTWGDGFSTSMLSTLAEAGIDRALLLLSDLHARAIRPEVAERAGELGYLIGPYDSYHSVHSPDAPADETWETARFDAVAWERGRVLRADGSGHPGFRNRGFHFAPAAAWPWVQRRVNALAVAGGYSAWFVDCDATAECFDDHHPDHPATRIDDAVARRERLRWLENRHRLVVGSEGGSMLFADVIHFGHGVHTPYLGHLEPAFRDRESPHFLGRYWPPHTPEQSFLEVPPPDSLRRPWFDPTVRVPLYQAMLGDELIATHHWSFDSLKFADPEGTRELLEILYGIAPLYHLNRGSWPGRRERILHRYRFWSPLHRVLATARLAAHDCLDEERLVQRATYTAGEAEIVITVNFDGDPRLGFPPRSATVEGAREIEQRVYRAGEAP